MTQETYTAMKNYLLNVLYSFIGVSIIAGAVAFASVDKTPRSPPVTATVIRHHPENSVVLVTVPGLGHGTGFYIGGNEFITAAHVAVMAKDGKVVLSITKDGPSINGTVEWMDAVRDVAMIKVKSVLINGERNGAPALVEAADLYCEKSDPHIGTPLHSIGFPLDLSRTETWGYVSTEAFASTEEGKAHYVTFTADLVIGPGNSGGPVFDSNGAVVGLADAIRLAPVSPFLILTTGFSVIVTRSSICAALTEAHAPAVAANTAEKGN